MPSGRCFEADLGPMTPTGQGGESTVYALDLIPHQVYKRYASKAQRGREADLAELIRLPGEMRHEHRELLIKMAAWPQMAVFDGGALVGVVIPARPTSSGIRHCCLELFVRCPSCSSPRRSASGCDGPRSVR